MKRLLAAVSALLTLLILVPAHAGKGTVALVPAHVFKGDAGNGPVVTQALRDSLERQGFTVLPAERVEQALRGQKLDTSRILTDFQLGGVRRATGADWVVYSRVLSVGMGINAKGERQANILVNVLGKQSRTFVHTKQVGHVFAVGDGEAPVIDRDSAGEAASKLMEAFYAKQK
jgi:hypothetical protein